MKKQTLIISAFAATLFFNASHASAQDTTLAPAPPKAAVEPAKKELQYSDVIPVVQAKNSDAVIDNSALTHTPLRLTPDKSEIIRLDKNIGSVIVGNPNHVNILVDSANMLIAVPRAPGASFFTVMDENGDVIMQRHVIVASPQKKYVRIRRNCTDNDCQPTSVYYCPDMCHEISISAETDGDSENVEELAQGENNSANTLQQPEPEEGQ